MNSGDSYSNSIKRQTALAKNIWDYYELMAAPLPSAMRDLPDREAVGL